MTVMYPRTGAVPSRTSATAGRLDAFRGDHRAGVPDLTELARSSSSAASKARASPVIPRRAWVAAGREGSPVLPAPAIPAVAIPGTRPRRTPRALHGGGRDRRAHPAVWCSRSVMSGPVSVCRACLACCSHRSPSVSSPVQISVPASIISAGAITGSPPQPCRSARAIASRQRIWVVANEWRTSDANPSCARQPTSRAGADLSQARLPECGVRLPARPWPPQRPAPRRSQTISATAVRRSRRARRVLVGLPGDRGGQEPGLLDERRPVSPRRLASDSCSDATATPRRRRRSGGGCPTCASATRCARLPRPGRPGRVTQCAHQGQPRWSSPAGSPAPAPAWSAPARRASG